MRESIQLTHSITLGKREIPLLQQMVPVADLQFFEQNPRIHSIIWATEIAPDQNTIELKLKRMDHVKQLVQSIKANGGVTDPLLVRKSDMVVLEGNSRLAACRALAGEDPAMWGKVKCDVIANNITDDDIFALLVQYHIVGKKDWDPFEQAGLFWRRYTQGTSSRDIAKEMAYLGISTKRVNQMINVYSFMVDHKDVDPGRWSYYDEYLKSRVIQKAREEHEELDDVVVKQIKSNEIKRAVDVRQKLPAICRVGGKTVRKYLDRETSLDTAFSRAEARGANNRLLSKVQSFREFISSPEAREAVQDLDKPAKCRSELRRIRSALNRLLEDIDKRP
jgi:ParB/Sulfiredoxin domain